MKDYCDKFSRPTNAYQRQEHDKIVAETGKRAAPCPGCHKWRWFEEHTLQMPDYVCDTCIIKGVPRSAEALAQRGELRVSQRHKKV